MSDYTSLPKIRQALNEGSELSEQERLIISTMIGDWLNREKKRAKAIEWAHDRALRIVASAREDFTNDETVVAKTAKVLRTIKADGVREAADFVEARPQFEDGGFSKKLAANLRTFADGIERGKP